MKFLTLFLLWIIHSTSAGKTLNQVNLALSPYTGNVREDVRFFTSDGEPLSTNEPAKFRGRGPVRIIIHGWSVDMHSRSVTLIQEAFLQKNPDSNLIIVDWQLVSKHAYCDVKKVAPAVGYLVAQMILHVSRTASIPLSQFTVIGHSMGGQIAGFAGKHLNGQLETLIALDPAFPLFSAADKTMRLDESDAKYVYVIHTNGQQYGVYMPIGHVDFYPNGGRWQVGCSTSSCSHGRAFEYYAESISSKRGFWAMKCDSPEDLDTCREDKLVQMGGEEIVKGLRGVYYLPTHNKSPFAKGKNWKVKSKNCYMCCRNEAFEELVGVYRPLLDYYL